MAHIDLHVRSSVWSRLLCLLCSIELLSDFEEALLDFLLNTWFELLFWVVEFEVLSFEVLKWILLLMNLLITRFLFTIFFSIICLLILLLLLWLSIKVDGWVFTDCTNYWHLILRLLDFFRDYGRATVVHFDLSFRRSISLKRPINSRLCYRWQLDCFRWFKDGGCRSLLRVLSYSHLTLAAKGWKNSILRAIGLSCFIVSHGLFHIWSKMILRHTWCGFWCLHRLNWGSWLESGSRFLAWQFGWNYCWSNIAFLLDWR